MNTLFQHVFFQNPTIYPNFKIQRVKNACPDFKI